MGKLVSSNLQSKINLPTVILLVLLQVEVDSLLSLVLSCSQEEQEQRQQELLVAAMLQVLFLILPHLERLPFQQSM
jgi:hypothetical protein